MSFEKSDVMLEFARIMAEQEKITPAKNPYAEDKKIIEEKRLFPDEDLIEEAHPEKVYVAESRGDGGLVENQNQQHEKMMTVINKMPTGALLGTYAATIDSLVKMANICDELQDYASANKLTETAEKIFALMDVLPFANGARYNKDGVSPVCKTAGFLWISDILRLGAKAAKWLVGHGGELVSAVTRSALETKPEMANVLKESLTDAERAAALAEKGLTTQTIKDLGQISSAHSTAWTEDIRNSLRSSWAKMRGVIEKSNSEIAASSSEAERIKTSLGKFDNYIKELSAQPRTEITAGQINSATFKKMELEDDLQKLTSNIENKQIAIQKLQEIQNEFEKGGGMAASNALDKAQQYSGVLSQNPELSEWRATLEHAISVNKDLLNLRSPNLSNDVGFVQEYMNLKTTPGLGKHFEMWQEVPDNMSKLIEMEHSGTFQKILSSGEIRMPVKALFSEGNVKTALQRAGTIAGIGTAGTAALWYGGKGMFSVYEWFTSHYPLNVNNMIETSLEPLLKNLKVSGEGQSIVQQMLQFLSNYTSLEDSALNALKTDHTKVAGVLSNMMRELNAMIGITEQWNTVIQNAGDKQLAQQAGAKISMFIDSQLSSLNALANRLGTTTIEDAEQGKPAPRIETNEYEELPAPAKDGAISSTAAQENDNLSKIQNLLDLPNTGILDNKTVRAIRELEQEFNIKSKDSKWIGKFISPKGDYAIDYNQLLEALNRIRKY